MTSGIQVGRLANIGLHVADLDRSLGFYRDLLGMTLHIDSGWQSDPGLLALSATPGGRIRIVNLITGEAGRGASVTLVQLAGLDRRPVSGHGFQDPGTVHLAFMVTDLDATLAALHACGANPVAPAGEVAGGGPGHARVAFVRDPDGTFVEFVQQLDPQQAAPDPEPE
jgi:catechol 2,3-dioxygenase-like lactoylglutathione lyase family enzyme